MKLSNLYHYMHKLWDSSWALFLYIGINYIYPFMLPIWQFLLLTLALVIFDTYVGIKASRKANIKIEANGIRRTSEKLFLYGGLILVFEGMRVVFMKDLLNITYAAAFVVCATELKSIVEKIDKLRGTNIEGMLVDKLSIFKTKKQDEDGKKRA